MIADTDNDGLNDRLETAFGTDPRDPDTDHDGHKDGAEVFAAYSPTSTGRVRLKKSIHISLRTQELHQEVMHVRISSFPVSTGIKSMPTPKGTFRILNKIPRAWSTVGKLWMPWWMHFSGRGHGIHELPEWPNGKKEGASHLGRQASHGCVRLGVGPAKLVYEWAPVGTRVTISQD